MNNAAAIKQTAPEMPKLLAPLLPKPRKPLSFARNGRAAAVLMTPREYQNIANLLAETEEEEDRYWAKIIDEMPDEEYLGVEESQKLTDDVKRAVAHKKNKTRR